MSPDLFKLIAGVPSLMWILQKHTQNILQQFNLQS